MLDIFLAEFNIQTFLFLSVTCFIAAFVDAIAGGGGLISVPPFVASWLPIHVAMGTNKMTASFSVLGNAIKYFISGNEKVLNLIANIVSLTAFIYFGNVSYLYSILVGFVMSVGAQCGAKYAIKKVSKFVKPFFIFISFITIAKMAIEKFL